MRATSLWNMLGGNGQTALLSAGGPGTGGVWSTVPLAKQMAFTNAQWSVATRLRLRCLVRPRDALTCQLPRKGEGEVCGEQMDQGLQHALECRAGPAVDLRRVLEPVL